MSAGRLAAASSRAAPHSAQVVQEPEPAAHPARVARVKRLPAGHLVESARCDGDGNAHCAVEVQPGQSPLPWWS